MDQAKQQLFDAVLRRVMPFAPTFIDDDTIPEGDPAQSMVNSRHVSGSIDQLSHDPEDRSQPSPTSPTFHHAWVM